MDEKNGSGKEPKEDKWKRITVHNSKEIKGFFDSYRFLSNFWPAKVFLDEAEYTSTENAYQAAKYKKEIRSFFETCSPEEAIAFVKANPTGQYSLQEWDNIKLEVMRKLLIQKFDRNLNPENYKKLIETESKYLEETNYWGDVYWGVNKDGTNEDGKGENNLGKLLMEIRDNLIQESQKTLEGKE